MISLPPIDPAIEISVSSQGMSKGLLQAEDGQVIVRPQLNIKSWTVVAQVKNIDSPATDAEAQLQLGWQGRAGTLKLTGLASYKFFIDASEPIDDRAWEFIGTATYPIGRAALKTTITYSPDDTGGTRRSVLAEVGASYDLSGSTTVSAGLGRRQRAGGDDYTAFNAGIAHKIGPASIEVRYYDTAQSGLGETYHSRVVLLGRAKF
jgi:hypothetical protein